MSGYCTPQCVYGQHLHCQRCSFICNTITALLEHADAEHPCWRGAHDYGSEWANREGEGVCRRCERRAA